MARAERPVRVALVGCGEVTDEKHLPALRNVRGAEIVAVVDLDPARAQRVADRFVIPHRFTDVRALLDACPVDAVGVCVPAQRHVHVALPLLQAGKHVLIEKPLALSLDEADELIAKARGLPAKAMVGFHMRWHRLVRRARAIVQSQQLGALETIRAIWNSPRGDSGLPFWKERRALGGGALIEIAVHHFDLWRFLLDTDVAKVYAISRHGRRDDECAVIAAELTNGMLASGVFSERTSHDIELEVCGHAGRLRVSGQRFDGLELYATDETSGMLRPRLRGLWRSITELPRGLSRMRRGGDYLDSYTGEWQHFIDAIRYDRSPECTLEDGRKALQVALATVESASRGEPVRVEAASPSVTAVTRA